MVADSPLMNSEAIAPNAPREFLEVEEVLSKSGNREAPATVIIDKITSQMSFVPRYLSVIDGRKASIAREAATAEVAWVLPMKPHSLRFSQFISTKDLTPLRKAPWRGSLCLAWHALWPLVVEPHLTASPRLSPDYPKHGRK